MKSLKKFFILLMLAGFAACDNANLNKDPDLDDNKTPFPPPVEESNVTLKDTASEDTTLIK